MKTLPQAPSLEYLKRQAKELLGALRESRPEATLSEAQRTLARQHGFRTWAELKAEVERLRSTPNLADAALTATIAAAFGLGTPSAPATIVSDDVMGPSLRLATDTGTWSAHAVLPWVDEQQAEEAVRLMEAAAGAGVRTPRAVRSVTGRLVEEAGEHRWRVDEWLDLGPTVAEPVPAATARKAGALLGALHALNLRPARGMNPWLGAQRRTAEQWEKIVAIVEDGGVPWAPALAAAVPAILDLSAIATEPPAGELILSLTNLIPSSVRVGEGGELVPVGWEYAGAIPPAWELGMALHSWTESVEGDLNERAAPALVEGYAAATGSEPALDLSIFAPAVTAWLNWLVSRITAAFKGQGEERERGERELQAMLAHPLSRESLERILRAASAGLR